MNNRLIMLVKADTNTMLGKIAKAEKLGWELRATLRELTEMVSAAEEQPDKSTEKK